MSTGFVILSAGQPWFQSGNVKSLGTPVPKERKSVAKNRATAKGKAVPIYPVFIESSKLITDKFWVTIFENLAMGKLPRGFRFLNGILSFKVRSKTTEKLINLSNPVQAKDEVLDFMRSMGMLSKLDNEEKKKVLDEDIARMAEVKISSWSHVRTKYQRNALIDQYCRRVIHELKLEDSKIRELESIIRIGILAGIFNSRTIHVDDNQITSIDFIVRDDKGKFYIDTNSVAPTRSKTKRRLEEPTSERFCDDYDAAHVTNASFGKQWTKFLGVFEKNTFRRTTPNPYYSSVPSTPLPS